VKHMLVTVLKAVQPEELTVQGELSLTLDLPKFAVCW
jgi:hypothetical protein